MSGATQLVIEGGGFSSPTPGPGASVMLVAEPQREDDVTTSSKPHQVASGGALHA